MKNDKKKLCISVLCGLGTFLLVFSLFQFLYQRDNKYTAGPPYGQDGIFAFSESDLKRKQPLFLIDGWEFYIDAKLPPDDFLAGHAIRRVNYVYG